MNAIIFLVFIVGLACLERLIYYISNHIDLLQRRKLRPDIFQNRCRWYVVGIMTSAILIVLHFALPFGIA